MTKPLSIAEARAAGILPPGNSSKTQSLAPSQAPRPSSAVITPEEDQPSLEGPKPTTRRSGAELAEHRRESALRPFFQVATHKGYQGKRVVFAGLTQSQVDTLRSAALAAGIPEQI